MFKYFKKFLFLMFLLQIQQIHMLATTSAPHFTEHFKRFGISERFIESLRNKTLQNASKGVIYPDFDTFLSEIKNLISNPGVECYRKDDKFIIKFKSAEGINPTQITPDKAPHLYYALQNLAKSKKIGLNNFFIFFNNTEGSMSYFQHKTFKLQGKILLSLADICARNVRYYPEQQTIEISLCDHKVSDFFITSEHELNHAFLEKQDHSLLLDCKILSFIFAISFVFLISSLTQNFSINYSVIISFIILVSSFSLNTVLAINRNPKIEDLNQREILFREEIYADINVSNPLEHAAIFCRLVDPTFPIQYPDNPDQFEALPEVQKLLQKQDEEEIDPSDTHPPIACRIRYLIDEAKKRIFH